MATETNVYISALQESLRKKQKILQEILELTTEQKEILAQEHPDMERFDQIMAEKEGKIAAISELDQGFDSLFQKIKDTLEQQKYQYKQQIQQMQGDIKAITDMGVMIQGMEHQNRDAFQRYLMQERQEIKIGRTSSQTAVSYYQNMPNQHHEWQSYFMDQKN